jgi:antitoxin (DNA-binding transcriptional repressor) of toxin-antitoxin stability system
MAMQVVSATDLARHTRKILDAVTRNGETVLVERNHAMIARIVPSGAEMSAARALADWQPMLSPQQGKAWLDESHGLFDETLRDPWA